MRNAELKKGFRLIFDIGFKENKKANHGITRKVTEKEE